MMMMVMMGWSIAIAFCENIYVALLQLMIVQHY